MRDGGRVVGRPSLAAKRRPEILDATVRSLAAHGLAGTTLERIAETAGMARGHIRHYAGNRDDLLADAAREFWLGGAADEQDGSEDATVIAGGDVEDALDFLFGEFAAPGVVNRAATAFVEASRESAVIRAIIVRAYDAMRDALDAVLAIEHPAAEPARRARVAQGVLAMALGNTFLTDVDASHDASPATRAAAAALVGTLS